MTEELKNWQVKTIAYESIRVEIGFVTNDDFYYGDQNDHDEFVSGKHRVALHKPVGETFGEFEGMDSVGGGRYLLSSSVADSPTELIRYYQDVLNQMQKYDMSPDQCETYFWLRPFLIYDGGSINFPWYDTFNEANRLLLRLECTDSGEVFWDADQGWELLMIARNGRLYIREHDPDDGEEYASINVSLESIQQQSKEIRLRANRIHDELKQACGNDYWSTKPYSDSIG